MRAYSLLVALFVISGCVAAGSNLNALRDKNPSSGGNFQEALASEYLAYAESLGEEGHPIRANYFAGKGLAALRGEDVPLEDKPALAKRRPAVVAVLTPDVKELAPAKAARAQLLYDCWAEKEGVCEQSFMQAFTDVQLVADALVHGGKNHFIANFEPGSAAINEATATILDIVASRVAGYGEYQVDLQVGTKNKVLATKRVLSIEKGLIARGVNAGRIHRHPSGTSKQVLLSVDKEKLGANSVSVTIETFEPPTEAMKP
jgi:hypothetical protein